MTVSEQGGEDETEDEEVNTTGVYPILRDWFWSREEEKKTFKNVPSF